MKTQKQIAIRAARAARAIPDVQATDDALSNVVLVAIDGCEFVDAAYLAKLREKVAAAEKMAGAAYYLAGRSFVGPGGLGRKLAEVRCLDAVKAYRAIE